MVRRNCSFVLGIGYLCLIEPYAARLLILTPLLYPPQALLECAVVAPYTCSPSALPLLDLGGMLGTQLGGVAGATSKDSDPKDPFEPVVLCPTPGVQQRVERSLASGLEREVTDWQKVAQHLRGIESDSVHALRCGCVQLQSADSLGMVFSSAEEAAAALCSDDVERHMFLHLHSAGSALGYQQLFDCVNAGLGAAKVLPTDKPKLRNLLLIASQHPGCLIVAKKMGSGARVRLVPEALRAAWASTAACPASLLEAARFIIQHKASSGAVAGGLPLLCSIYDVVPALKELPRGACHAMLAGLAAWAITGQPALLNQSSRGQLNGRGVQQASLAG